MTETPNWKVAPFTHEQLLWLDNYVTGKFIVILHELRASPDECPTAVIQRVYEREYGVSMAVTPSGGVEFFYPHGHAAYQEGEGS